MLDDGWFTGRRDDTAGLGDWAVDPAVWPAGLHPLVKQVRDAIGPVAAFRRVDVVESLPKTRSGKVLRRSLRDVLSGSDKAPPPTIEDPAVLDAIREQVQHDERS